jgi:uroporphyrinogen-III synthase
MSIAPLLGRGLVGRGFRVPAREVVFVKAVLDASDGLGAVFAERGGDLVVFTTESQVRELDRLLHDLVPEVGGVLTSSAAVIGPEPSRDRCESNLDPLA